MAETNRQFVSSIQVPLTSLSPDLRLSPKFILTIGQSVVADFLKKDSESRRVSKASEGWSELQYLPMEEVSINECGDLGAYCNKLMKSKIKVPDTFTGYYGNIIKYVSSLNFKTNYQPLRTPSLWRDIQEREFVDKRIKYYFFINQYLYIPNSEVEAIRMEAYFKNPLQVHQINNKNCKECDKCVKYMDLDFICPEYLLNDVKKETMNIILTKYKIQPDERDDLNKFNKTEQK